MSGTAVLTEAWKQLYEFFGGSYSVEAEAADETTPVREARQEVKEALRELNGAVEAGYRALRYQGVQASSTQNMPFMIGGALVDDAREGLRNGHYMDPRFADEMKRKAAFTEGLVEELTRIGPVVGYGTLESAMSNVNFKYSRFAGLKQMSG